MIEGCRVIQSSPALYASRATSTQERAAALEAALELTKPRQQFPEWDPLIAAPFRYPFPVPSPHCARFKPSFFPKNVLYASHKLVTALYEHAYHFLVERRHLDGVRDYGQRNAFTLFIDPNAVTDLRRHAAIAAIMNRHSYEASYEYMQSSPPPQVLCYPSCRDPEKGDNFAVFEIHALAKEIGQQKTFVFYFDPTTESIHWTDLKLQIAWKDVS